MKAMREWQAISEQGLAKGITLLEASAGTGKTYNITSLILRLVAERGVQMRETVVVTFTRAATAELKDRIRVRIAEAVDVLEGRKAPKDDEVLSFLLEGSKTRGADWLRNLRAAQESFDECLISTIHGFCQRMLQQNAFESRTDFDLELLDETSAVREEIIDDWLSKNLHPDDPERFTFLTSWCGFDRKGLDKLTEMALRDPDVKVVPKKDEVTVAGWAAERDAFLAQWEAEWGPSLPKLYEQAHARGIFAKPRQSTYRQAKCAEKVDELTAWLRSAPAMVDRPPDTKYWSEKAVGAALADGQPEPSNEALVALRRLLRYPERAAACESSAFVQWVREEFDQRMRARRVQSYQDLMRNLARVLRDEHHPSRKALVHAIGSRYKAALIDEFQDTDALQWNIFRDVFGDEDHWLYLIGDPKQAIYGFRGANVHVYLAAKQTAKHRTFTMRTNFRSDARIVDGFNHLMGHAGFFAEPGIDYVAVKVAPRRETPDDRIRYRAPFTDPFAAPVQLRFIDQRLSGAQSVSDSDEAVSKDVALALIPGRVADDMVELLEGGTRIHDPGHRLADPEGFRPIRPGDMAVLTRTGKQAVQIQDALAEAGIPSVLQGAESVLKSEEALDLQRWLEALGAPGYDAPARTAATTRLFGRAATLIARVDAQDREALQSWDGWLARLARWREVMAQSGLLRALRLALQEDRLAPAAGAGEPEDVTTRLLRRPDGERRLTNLWHLAELLHDAETRNRLHLAGLLAWLKRERAETTIDAETAETRLERDDEAVSIMTMHKSKGLEFPVVLVPYLWDGHGPKEHEPLLLPKQDAPAERILDVHAAGDRKETFERAWHENHKEQLRLLYVACTRAKLRCVAYVGHVNLLSKTPLAPALHGELRPGDSDRIGAGIARAEAATQSQLWDDIAELAKASLASLPDRSRAIALTACAAPSGRKWTAAPEDAEPLVARDFLRFGLDRTWRRHSYTSLAHGTKAAYLSVLEDEGVDRDADEERPRAEAVTERLAALPSYEVPADAPSVPLGDFQAGADAGTFLHTLFEKADFLWAHPEQGGEKGSAELRTLIEQELPAHGFDAERWAELIHHGMLAVLRTPLGGELAHTRLCDIPACARLNEFRFDFPLAGGSAFGQEPHKLRVRSEAIVQALRLRKAPSPGESDEATMRTGYLDGLERFGDLAGFMTGSMDLVFRHVVDGKPKWFLVDYKSNRLDPFRLGRWPIQSFCLAGMRYAMEQSHYYLQYHIYLLALHRYLRLRLGGDYSYAEHLGGAYYLFFRGMIGQDTPTEDGRRHGCFYDKPPFQVIEALDRLFADPAAAPRGGAR